jgi:hypothetical protein
VKINVTGGQEPGLGMTVRSFLLESRADGLYVDLQLVKTRPGADIVL